MDFAEAEAEGAERPSRHPLPCPGRQPSAHVAPIGRLGIFRRTGLPGSTCATPDIGSSNLVVRKVCSPTSTELHWVPRVYGSAAAQVKWRRERRVPSIARFLRQPQAQK